MPARCGLGFWRPDFANVPPVAVLIFALIFNINTANASPAGRREPAGASATSAQDQTYPDSKVHPIEQLFNVSPDFSGRSVSDVLFDNIGLHEPGGGHDDVNVSFLKNKFSRTVYDNNVAGYTVADTYNPSIGDNDGTHQVDFVFGMGTQITVFHQADTLADVQRRARSAQFLNAEDKTALQAWVKTYLDLPRNLPNPNPLANKTDPTLAQPKSPQAQATLDEVMKDAQTKNATVDQIRNDPNLKSIDLPAAHPLSADRLLGDTFEVGDVVQICNEGDLGAGVNAPGYFGLSAGVKVYKTRRNCVDVLKEPDGKVKMKIQIMPNEKGEYLTAGMSLMGNVPVVGGYVSNFFNIHMFGLTIDQNKNKIYERTFEYDLNQPCGYAAANAMAKIVLPAKQTVKRDGAAREDIATAVSLTLSCTEKNLGVTAVQAHETIAHDQRRNNRQVIRSMELGVTAYAKSSRTDVETRDLQKEVDGQHFLSVIATTTDDSSHKNRWIFGHHQETKSVQMQASGYTNAKIPNTLGALSIDINLTDNKTTSVSQRWLSTTKNFIENATGITAQDKIEWQNGSSRLFVQAVFPPRTVQQMMRASEDQLWMAIGKALVPSGKLDEYWKDPSAREQWMNSVTENHSPCVAAKGMSGKTVSCSDVFKKAESVVKKLEGIQRDTNMENQLRDLTNLVNPSGDKPYLMRMFLELSKGHPSCSRWKVDNNGNTYSGDEVCRNEGDVSPIGQPQNGAGNIAADNDQGTH